MQGTEFLVRSFDSDKRCWPAYWPSPPAINRVSFTSTAMILHSLHEVLGHGLLLPNELATRASEIQTQARETLLQKINDNANAQGKEPLFDSRTFGAEDPMTLFWVSIWKDRLSQNALERLRSRAEKILQQPQKQLDFESSKRGSDTGLVQPRPHALLLLYALRAARELAIGADTGNARDFLEARVHKHLAYQRVRSPRFDIAELIFAADAYMLCQDGSPERERFASEIAAVLASHQATDRLLRPVAPLVSDRYGMALYPIATEVFMSIVAAASESSSLVDPTPIKAALRDCTSWILGRRITCMEDGRRWRGWISENSAMASALQPWKTSQAALCLAKVRGWLSVQAVEDFCSAAGIPLERRPRVRSYQPDGEDEIKKFGDSLAEATSTAGIYQSLWDRLINPRRDRSTRPQKSALLYGPPGTGKSVLASWIAAQLGYPLLTVTPSTFAIHGEQSLEEQTQAIFDGLSFCERAVVLFDEIDKLILDRNSSMYLAQGDTVQFLTPGLLVRLQNLRDLGSRDIIFLVATNYGERIDGAIKRPGRFDLHLLVLPPNSSAREETIKRELLATGASLSTDDKLVKELAEKLAFLTGAEIGNFVAKHGEDSLVVAQKESPVPTTRLSSYAARFWLDKEPGSAVPREEFVAMLRLWCESSPLARIAEALNVPNVKKIVQTLYPNLENSRNGWTSNQHVSDFLDELRVLVSGAN